jgi:cell division protein ZapA (FtsZ GTPase activity inhibitor)
MVITAVGIITAINALVALSKGVVEVGSMIKNAQAEGRDLNAQELKQINDKYDNSFLNLDEAIAKKEAEEKAEGGSG